MDHARRKVIPREFGSELEKKGQLIEECCQLNEFDLAQTEISTIANFLINCDNTIDDRVVAKRALQELIRKSKD